MVGTNETPESAAVADSGHVDRKLVFVITGIVLLWLLLCCCTSAGITLLSRKGDVQVPKKSSSRETPRTPDTTSTHPSGYDYTLAYLPHAKGVIIDGGFPVGSTPEQKKEIVANAAARDPFVLWYFLTRIYELEDVPSPKELENLDLRIAWHQKLLLLLEASDFKEVSLDGKTFFNEGVNSDGQVTAGSTSFGSGVPGTEISLGGKTKTVKDNCVNRQVSSFPPNTIKGPDTTEGAARQPIRDENAVTEPTPGYDGGSGTSGPAEAIAEEQQETAGDTTNNGQVGHTGPAVPGTNDSGETNTGGGASETALPGGVETPATGDLGPPQ
jgi:hypothetical protein